MKHFTTLGGLAAVSALMLAGASVAQTPTSGWFASDSGTSVQGGVVTLNSNGQSDGTSYENLNVDVQVANGQTVSFEYMGRCGGGAPRVFIQGGAYNTFDQNPNTTACGTDTDGDGWFTVTQTITGITAGPAGHVGIVNDNISDPRIIRVRNLTIAGVRIRLSPSASPVSAEQCKKGGWQALGYRNQGQCVSSMKSNRPARD